MDVNTAIECTNAGCRLENGRWALRGVNLRIEAGQRIGILGPNGAGKTTLLLMLVGVRPVSEGEVHVMGRSVATAADLAWIRNHTGLVFQEPDDQLFCATVYDDVAFGPRQLQLDEREVDGRVRAALEAVDMADEAERVSHHLSAGQKRRVALATVLAMQPEILLLDEPTNDLDPRGRKALQRILSARDQTLLIASHDLEFVLAACSRAVLLDEGKLIAAGPTRELLADAALMEAHGLEVPASLRPSSASLETGRVATRGS